MPLYGQKFNHNLEKKEKLRVFGQLISPQKRIKYKAFYLP